MALQLLGGKYCIESLRNDVTDLQEAVIDVMSRAGPVRLPSWKYPDKISSDLDMTELLEIYDYSEDEEDRQIAHIVLLELVIDRMVLLFQSLTKFMDSTLVSTGGRAAPSPQQNTVNNNSIGLIIKKYWNKSVHLQSYTKTMISENKMNKRKITDLENNMKKVMEEREQLIDTTETLQETIKTSKTPFPLNESKLEKLNRAASVISISKDECNKATQTYETAFVPCESCHCVQKCLKETGNTIIALCQSQSLPSCLAKFKPQVDALDWMTGNDVIRWTSEQNKDITRLNKLLAELDTLRSELSEEKGKNAKLLEKNSECNKEIKLERETQNTQRRHYETKIKHIQNENETAMNFIKKENKELADNKKKLEQQIDQVKLEMNKQQNMLQELDHVKENLEKDLKSNKVKNTEIKNLEKDMNELEAKLKEVSGQLSSNQEELSKEKAKCKSLSKHTESVQTKQEALLQRIDALDQNNEDLQSQLDDLECEKEKLEETLYTANKEKEDLEHKLKSEQKMVKEINREKVKLEQSLMELQTEVEQIEGTLQEAKEREKLIIEYPDLNGPVNPDLTGTGDIVKDMENQVKANHIRIEVLEEQNTKLRSSITRILQVQGNNNIGSPVVPQTNPIPLWKKDSARESSSEPAEKRYSKPPKSSKSGLKMLEQTSEDTKVRQSFVIGRGRVTPDKRNRPPSAKHGNVACDPVAQKKYGGHHQKEKVRSSSGHSPNSDHNQYQNVIICPNCDQMYQSKKDLDIHKSYCQR